MKLDAIISLNQTGFTNPLNQAMGAMRSAMGALAAMAGVTATVAGAIAGVKRALDFGGAMSDLSAVTGVAAGELVVLRQAFADTGVGAEAVRPVLGFMQRSLSGMNEEGGRTAETFRMLGLDMAALRSMPPTAAMQAITGAIGKLGNEADKTAAIMAIFGRGGAMMKSLMADPKAFDTARAALGDLPNIMERNAGAFDRMSDTLGRVKAKSMGLFAGIAEGALPALDGFRGALDGIDLTGFGQRLGDAIATGTQLFRDGEIGSVLALSLKIAMKEAVNLFATGMEKAGVLVLAIFTDAGLWKGVWDFLAGGLQGAFSGLVGVLMKVFAAPIAFLRTSMDKIVGELFEFIGKIPGVGKLLGVEGFQAKTMAEYQAENDASVKAWSDAYMGVAKSEFGRARDAAAEVVAGVKRVKDVVDAVPSTKIFDSGREADELSAILAKANLKIAETRRAIQAATAIQPAQTGGADLAKAAQKTGGKPEIASDSLAKIGLYVGGAGALADPMRRVANSAERQVRLLGDLIRLTRARSAPATQMLPV